MALNQVTEGHTLVVPIRHVKDIYELPDDLAGPLLPVPGNGTTVSHAPPRPNAITGVPHAIASTITSPAPPTARLPRWTKCQSVGMPSCAEYWHIGETKIRFRKVVPRSVSGSNK